MKLWLIIWPVLIFASLAWYSFLLFYVGYKGGREIQELTRTLGEQGRNRRHRPE
jgi:hypothetical protein